MIFTRERFRKRARPHLEASMATHKYTIGETVSFRSKLMGPLVVAQDCKILRLMPRENGSYLYRIKCVVENVERVVAEGELAARVRGS